MLVSVKNFASTNVVIPTEFEICVVNSEQACDLISFAVIFATQNLPAYLIYEVFWFFKYLRYQSAGL